MTVRVNLDSVAGCPVADRCAACGDVHGLAVVTAQTQVGVYCLTLCPDDREADRLPSPPSWSTAIEMAGAHCGHLGIDVDQMEAEMVREQGDEPQ